MSVLPEIIVIVVGLLTLIGWLFRLLDVMTGRQTKDRLKAQIEKFWIETHEIGFAAQLHEALIRRYQRTRAVRFRFLVLFWIFCGMVAVTTIYFSIKSFPAGNTAAAFKTLVQLDFDKRYAIHCGYLSALQGRNAKEFSSYCDPANEDGPKEISHYREKKLAYDQLIDRLALQSIALPSSALLTSLFEILILIFPLSLALWLSFNVTLRLLSKITDSKLNFLVLVTLDIFTALFMPPLLTSAMVSLLVATTVVAFGQIPDLFAFGEASFFTLTLGTSLLMLTVTFIFPALSIMAALVLPGIIGIPLAAVLAVVVPVGMAVQRVPNFFADAIKLLGMDFSTEQIAATINWAIFTDLLFSLTYLGPCLALVLANRSERARHIFLNTAMWIHDHKGGPFTAISELLSSIPKNPFGK